jgi:hypothetical protein
MVRFQIASKEVRRTLRRLQVTLAAKRAAREAPSPPASTTVAAAEASSKNECSSDSDSPSSIRDSEAAKANIASSASSMPRSHRPPPPPSSLSLGRLQSTNRARRRFQSAGFVITSIRVCGKIACPNRRIFEECPDWPSSSSR